MSADSQYNIPAEKFKNLLRDTLKMDALNFPLACPAAGENELEISIGRAEETEEVENFMKENFFREPPIHQIHAYDETPEATKELYSFLLNIYRKCLNDGVSLLVREKSTRKLVAVRINELLEARETCMLILNAPNRLIFALLASLCEGYDLHSMYNVERILSLSFACVSQPYQRFGLATKLYQLSIDLAKVYGAGVIKVEAVSEYAARALAKLGFTVVNSIDYDTFEYKGIRPLEALVDQLAAHRTARLMALRLP